MADVLSTTYKFVMPEVGGSDDTWGDKLNANFATLDGLLASATHTESGFSAGSATDLGGAFRLAGASPYVQFVETDATLPAGRYRWYGFGGSFVLLANTAAAGDFTTSTNIITATAAGLSFGVPITSATFTGNPTIQNDGPALNFEEADQTDPAGRFRFQGVSGALHFQRATAANWGSAANIWYYASGTFTLSPPVAINNTLDVSSVAHVQSIYVGATPAGAVAANTLSAATGSALNLRGGIDTAGLVSFLNAAGTTVARVDSAGATVAAGQTLITAEKGDARYLRLAGDTMTGALTMTGVLKVANGIPSAPGLAFVPEANTGWYMPGLGSIRTVTAGVEVFQCAVGSNTSFVPLDMGTAAASAAIRFQRTGNPNVISVPDGASLRIQNATGTAWATVSTASGWAAGISDARLKENVTDIHYGLDTILALRPVEFDWIEEKRHDIGLIAQEVRPLIPELVEVWKADPDSEDQQDTLALRKDALVAVLIKAVQELAARVQTLEGAT